MKKRICIVTGSRSEYGLLYYTIKRVKESPNLELSLIVTGTHLSPEFGYTIKEINKDKFRISEKIEMLLSSDSGVGIAKSMGVGIISFADCFIRQKPDILLVLGDRFEIFAAVSAAMALRIPVAHISGGDVTEGVMDEQIRHAITKMSHIHFVALEKHDIRVKQMGEESWRVFSVGEPCIDRIKYLKKIPRRELFKNLGFEISHPSVLVTFHPVTLSIDETRKLTNNLLKSLSKLDVQIIFTYPNADSGGREIIKTIKKLVSTHPNAFIFKSLGIEMYLNLLYHVDAVVGNSSCAIPKAPSFRLPAVNIGNRQKGRIIPDNVICTSSELVSISRGIRKALDPEFRSKLKDIKNPYDKGGTAQKIVKILNGLEIDSKLLCKKFSDIK